LITIQCLVIKPIKFNKCKLEPLINKRKRKKKLEKKKAGLQNKIKMNSIIRTP